MGNLYQGPLGSTLQHVMAGLDPAISTPHRTCKRCKSTQQESHCDGRSNTVMSGLQHMVRIFIITATLSTWSLCRANAGDTRAEIVATDLRFPEGTIFVGNDLYFVGYVLWGVRR